MTTPIELLWRQALKTFSGRSSASYKFCQKNFEKLHSLINSIKAEDIEVNKNVLDYVENNSAPMCVIDVFENQDITIAVFLLKHDVTLPMHDHPGMHGLLKVINGTIKIDSFTTETRLQDGNMGDEILAVKYPPILVDKNSPACVLTPDGHNIHEITCIKGPAAFLDILSPPYNVDTSGNGVTDRPCTFFKQISLKQKVDDGPVKVKLIPIEQPSCFYSTGLKYLGAPLR